MSPPPIPLPAVSYQATVPLAWSLSADLEETIAAGATDGVDSNNGSMRRASEWEGHPATG